MRTLTRVGWDCCAVSAFETPLKSRNGFGRSSRPDCWVFVVGIDVSINVSVLFFLEGDKDRLPLEGLALRALGCGGICLGGDSDIVGFSIDLTD